MLRSAQSLIGYRVRAGRDDVGRLGDILFDSNHWLERTWVINSMGLLESKEEAFVPIELTEGVDHRLQEITLSVSKSLVAKSPNLREHAPGATWPQPRYSEHYQWPFFWTGAGTLGTAKVTPPSEALPKNTGAPVSLFSSVEAFRYRLMGTDGVAGYVEDFILDDQTWAIRYAIVTAKRWWPISATAIPTNWVSDLSWEEHLLKVDLSQKEIKRAPRFDRLRGVIPEFEEAIARHYAARPVRRARKAA